MHKKPVMFIITALSALGLVIAVGIFTKLRMENEAAITDSQQHTGEATPPSEPAAADAAPADAAPPAEDAPASEAPATAH